MNNNQKIMVGSQVKPKVSVKKHCVGTVVGIGANPAMPFAVVFDDNVEWDFKYDELELLCDCNGTLRTDAEQASGVCEECR